MSSSFHPWKRFFQALAAEKSWDDAAITLAAMNAKDRVEQELFDSFLIEGTGPGIPLDKKILREYGIAPYFNKFSDPAKDLFKNQEIRDYIFLYFILGLSNEEVADEIPKRFPNPVDKEDIAMFRQLFWCAEDMPDSEIQAFAQTWLKGKPADFARRVYAEDPVMVRYELGLPLKVRDISMLQRIKDKLYVETIGAINDTKRIAQVMKFSDALTKLMVNMHEVEQHTMTEEELKPLYKPTFEEATKLITLEELVEQGENITGGEARPEVEEVLGEEDTDKT